MRKYIKKGISNIIETLYEAHSSVNDLIGQGKYNEALSLLGECQNTAVEIGGIIENSEGEGFCTIHTFENYCEIVYQIAVSVSENEPDIQIKKKLDDSLSTAENSIENDIKIRLEIVFMPYKASMWDSLESIWKSFSDKPDFDVYVVPIPYYDRNPDHSFGTYHYEGNLYPDYVPIVHYNNYDLASRKPDIIYIHNPYDDKNYVTSVDPRFYSNELKKYTETLVYIPYFVLQEPDQINDEYLNFIDNFCLYSGIYNADKVIVQSEKMREAYILSLLRYYGVSDENKQIFENKIIVRESPKFEKVANTTVNDIVIPESWNKIIKNSDGSAKKIVLYNTSVNTMINTRELMISKIKNVLDIFYKNRDNVVLLWRPHPLLISSLGSMFPQLLDQYKAIVKEYKDAGWGIYDDSPDLDRAIVLCDAYYGDPSSVVQLVQKVGKPIMIQNVNVIE